MSRILVSSPARCSKSWPGTSGQASRFMSASLGLASVSVASVTSKDSEARNP